MKCIFTASLVVSGMLLTNIACSAEPLFDGAEFVEFESSAFTYPPSPFKVKRAKKLGIAVKSETEPSVPLTGYLVKPSGEGRFPAVILLHTCAGISEHEESWSERLVSWGYVVLTVDSLTPRGDNYICDGSMRRITPWARALDAHGAREFLSTRAFVDPNRVAVMGLSHGGMATLEAIRNSTSTGLATIPFQAAVVFYPLCSQPEPIDTPTLILIGSEDNWTPPDLCREYLSKLQPPYEVVLKVFTGAHHAFDHPGIDIVELGHTVRSNTEATEQAVRMTREFLSKRM